MTNEQQALMRAVMRPLSDRIRKIGRSWYVTNLEKPGEILEGPSFTTKTKALAYAKANQDMVCDRVFGRDRFPGTDRDVGAEKLERDLEKVSDEFKYQ